jgi:hypothetical protein
MAVYRTYGWTCSKTGLPGTLFFVLSDNVIHSIGEASFEEFKENLHKKFDANGMIHTMLSLYGKGHNQRRSENSLFSGDYKERPRYCDGLE